MTSSSRHPRKRRAFDTGSSPHVIRTTHHASATRFPPDLQTHATHPWLQFPDGSPGGERLAELLKRQFATTWTVDWDTLKTLHLHDRAKDMMGPVWLRFFSIKHLQYKELCLEFLSTYEFQTPCTDYSYGRSIRFRMAGIERSCSLIEFSRRMGLYTDEEMETDIFLKGLTKLPSDVSPQQFWAQIGEGPYQGKFLKSTRLKDPFYRILHRIIAQSIAGRKESTGVVTQKDQFFLYCFIRPAACNVAYVLASYFSSLMGKMSTTHICGGSYITQLAKSYGVLTPEACATLTSFLPTQTLDMVVLTNMKVVEQTEGGGWKLLDGHGEIWQPDPSQHEEEPHQQHEVAPDRQHPVKQEDTTEQHDQQQPQEEPQQQSGTQQLQEEALQQQHADPLSHRLGVTSLDLVAMVTELQHGQQRLEQEHQRRHQETMSALRCIARYFAIPDFPQQQHSRDGD
ncbi:hypothetical protein M8C21_025279 [Ambrosia artemisiifolia]|uniref:Arabidopsis retrotransposon Orf1 C-terminal domain-containing protein n=1 Tax=Ambrosia artemisiifolia TaxID=4212 RepID=A0AAD5GMT8_AMBAR|nr:hypothetical protein M8C21_025279 [Ambrosia artemisiifolia]